MGNGVLLWKLLTAKTVALSNTAKTVALCNSLLPSRTAVSPTSLSFVYIHCSCFCSPYTHNLTQITVHTFIHKRSKQDSPPPLPLSLTSMALAAFKFPSHLIGSVASDPLKSSLLPPQFHGRVEHHNKLLKVLSSQLFYFYSN